jgi:hypothetical protein|tara:strand:+ start:5832 stop:6257 length:426 start_codon:yes stop_codon:yes gene_type:complete
MIKNLMINEKVVEVEFPDSDNFYVSLTYLNREKLTKIRNRSLTIKFNKRSRQREEEVDNEKFLEEYAREVVRGWRGLTIRELARLMPIETAGANLEQEVPYSEEDALELLRNSTIFDQFVTDCQNDFEVFEKDKTDSQVKN